MKKNLLKKSLCIISLMSIIAITLPTNSKAYENIQQDEQESEYVSLTTIDFTTNEETTFQVSSQDIGTVLEACNTISVESTPGISPCAIIGTSDDRTLITNTEAYPYSAIGYLKGIDANNTDVYYVGTAFMVAPNVALTAAHCLYNDNGVRLRRLEFSPAKNGSENPFGTTSTIVVGATATVPSDYLTNPNAGNDWAVIKFMTNIGDECDWLNLQTSGYSVGPTGDNFYVSGYPLHDSSNPKYIPFRTAFLDAHREGFQFRASDKISSVKTRYIVHKIDALPGQSGSPVYYYDQNNQVRVVGIHNRSGDPIIDENGLYSYTENNAARINYTIINAIDAITQ